MALSPAPGAELDVLWASDSDQPSDSEREPAAALRRLVSVLGGAPAERAARS